MLFCSKLGFSVDILKINTCPLCGGQQLEHALTCTDHYASGETFEVVRCVHCGFLMTQNAPVEAEIGKYYETPDYISHSDTQKGLMNRVYHWVRQFMLAQKAALVKRTSKIKKGTILDYGTGTGYFAHTMKGTILLFVKGLWTGTCAWFGTLGKKERSSSMIYVFRKK